MWRKETDEAYLMGTFARQSIAGLSNEQQELFEMFGAGAEVELEYACIHHAFEAWVEKSPDSIAARHLDDVITYGELNRQADHLAGLLTQHGVSVGDNVAIFLQRSIPMLVGILAVLKVGAAYVPQHAGVASELQLRHVVATAATHVILTVAEFRSLIPVPEGHVCIAIDEVMRTAHSVRAQPDRASNHSAFVPSAKISGDHRCFILFTSGTTGLPNGVQIAHRNVCNILLSAPGHLGMRPGVKVGQILSIAFDLAAWEILGCLANGATLLIRGKDIGQTVRQADVVIATPSILNALDADTCRAVSTVAVAGEPCPQPLADKWSAFCTFYNACGPTETTIVNTMQHYVGGTQALTIGTPTPNNTIYILDEARQPSKIGEIGEVWAGGACVSLGYLNNEALNRERYAPDPFLADGRMMFRTRDLGRWTAGGELEHLGRLDDQVKIRGFRVELDSVSTVFESEPSCHRAVTLKFDNYTLVTFLSPLAVNIELARQRVSRTLPYYCMPSAIIAVDELPLTSRGKIDKSALLRRAIESESAWRSEVLAMGVSR